MKITVLRISFRAFILKTLLQVASASVSTEMEDRETEIFSSSMPSQPLQEKSQIISTVTEFTERPSPIDISMQSSSNNLREKLIWGITTQQINQFFDESVNLVCFIDQNQFHRVNLAWSQVLGRTAHELVSQPYSKFLHPDDNIKTQSTANLIVDKRKKIQLDETLNKKKSISSIINFENRYRTSLGDYRTLQWLVFLPVLNVTPQTPFLCIVKDVTLQQQAAEQKRTFEYAQITAKMKSTFVAHISHELRTPLNGVIGFLDLALEEEMSATLKYHLGHARQSAGLLLDIANNIVDVSRLEAGRLSMQQEIFSPIDSLKSVVDSLQEAADHKNITFKVSASDAMPLLVQGDAHRFQQILFNLGSNAIKFTQHGKVSIKLDSHPILDKPQQIMIRGRVKDTGIGIKPHFLPKLFQPFSQEDQSMKRDVGGTGLGLYLTKELCEKMNGFIHVLSTPGLGSTFEFKVMMNSMDVDL